MANLRTVEGCPSVRPNEHDWKRADAALRRDSTFIPTDWSSFDHHIGLTQEEQAAIPPAVGPMLRDEEHVVYTAIPLPEITDVERIATLNKTFGLDYTRKDDGGDISSDADPVDPYTLCRDQSERAVGVLAMLRGDERADNSGVSSPELYDYLATVEDHRQPVE
jgi:hypothetical protein